MKQIQGKKSIKNYSNSGQNQFLFLTHTCSVQIIEINKCF
jgi:hypothetical protein